MHKHSTAKPGAKQAGADIPAVKQAARQAVSPRLLRREKKIIFDRFIQWADGDTCCTGYGPDRQAYDFRFGRAIVNFCFGVYLTEPEVRAEPEILIEKWRPR